MTKEKPVRHQWTESDDNYLREHYPTKDVEVIAAHLGVTVHSVRKRAQTLEVQSWRMWSRADREMLRDGWGKVRTRTLARRLGRSPVACKRQAVEMGLDVERYYTDAEKDLVRQLYPTHSASQIARRLHGTGRSAKAVYRLAMVLGLRKHPHHDPEILDRVRALHAEGFADRLIAERIGLASNQVKHLRRRLGLPTIHDLEGKQLGARRQLETLGLSSRIELKMTAHRKFACENGWPASLRLREVQILNLLCAVGLPMTKREIAEGIGMRTDRIGCNGSPVLLHDDGTHGSYTRSLEKLGLITRLSRSRPMPGRRAYDTFILGPEALRILEERRWKETCGGHR